MTRLYWRCNGGHYFCTLRCPFDGWTSSELAELHAAAERLQSKNMTPSVAALRGEGVGEAAIQRAIVVEFGSDKSAFDAISPESYILVGKEVKLTKAGRDFL
jgi:hypothetical protein